MNNVKVIDCTTPPRGIPYWCNFDRKEIPQVTGRVADIVEWDPSRLTFFTPENPENERLFSWKKLLEKIQGQRLVTANVLDFLRDDPKEMPEWLRAELRQKNGKLHFFGSIGQVGAESKNGSLCAEYLYWGKPFFESPFFPTKPTWQAHYHLLDFQFFPDIKVAVWRK
jgi:hypothetical protein